MSKGNARGRAQEALQALAQAATARGGTAQFLQECVRQLTRAYQAHCAFIGVFTDESRTRVRTLGFFRGDAKVPSLEYDLEGTPSRDVLEHRASFIPRGAAARYPGDRLLVELGIEGYFGVPLLDETQAPLGLVSVMDVRPMTLSPIVEPVLRTFAGRIAAELQRERAIAALERSERRYRELIQAAHDVILTLSPEGHITSLNAAFEQLTGWPASEWLGRSFAPLLDPGDLARARGLLERSLGQGLAGREEVRVRTRDGRSLVAEITMTPLGAGTLQVQALCVARDVTERRRVEEALGLAASVFETSLEGILITDRWGTILSVNPAVTQATGYSAEELVGRNPHVFSSGRQDRAFYRRLWAELRDTGSWSGEIWNRRKNGEVYLERLRITAVRDQKGEVSRYIGVFSDITEQRRSEDLIRKLAYYDPLTGLPNRRLFEDRLQHALAQARRDAGWVVVLCVDLSRLGAINDSLGHTTGDDVLKATAERIAGCVREADTVARLRGDEYGVMLRFADKDHAVVQASQLASRVMKEVSRPLALAGHELAVSCTVGIALFPQDASSSAELIRNAYTAMHHSRGAGRELFGFFTEEMNLRARERLVLEGRLRNAAERGELVLHYQPMLEAGTRRLVGVEALVRWRAQGERLRLPAEFVPLAEETGLIHPIGAWVLRSACRQLATWRDAGHRGLRMSINLSPQQFRIPGLVELVADALQESRIEPRWLELEITESNLLGGEPGTLDLLRDLQAMGVRICVDDFGTGYASLSYLRRFPVSSLKVDRSFVNGIPHQPDDMAITTAIIAMARSLKLSTVAEGVETPEQLAFLREQGCQEVQGFLFSPAIPASEMGAWLTS